MATTTAKKAPAKKEEKKVVSLEQVRGNLKKAGYAYLGIFGKTYDEAQNLVEELRGRADKGFDSLVGRGEKLETELKDNLKKVELPKMPERVTEAVEKAKENFESLTEKFAPKKAS